MPTTQNRILALVRRTPRLSLAAIRRKLRNITHHRINSALKDLVEAGSLVRRPDRTYKVSPRPPTCTEQSGSGANVEGSPRLQVPAARREARGIDPLSPLRPSTARDQPPCIKTQREAAIREARKEPEVWRVTAGVGDGMTVTRTLTFI